MLELLRERQDLGVDPALTLKRGDLPLTQGFLGDYNCVGIGLGLPFRLNELERRGHRIAFRVAFASREPAAVVAPPEYGHGTPRTGEDGSSLACAHIACTARAGARRGGGLVLQRREHPPRRGQTNSRAPSSRDLQ